MRVADFLIGRIQSKTNRLENEEDKIQLERERIKEQVELLNVHLPKIMDLGTSSFDKSNKGESSLSKIKEIKEIITP